MRRHQNQLLMLGTKISAIAFWGGPYRFTTAGLASRIQISKLLRMD